MVFMGSDWIGGEYGVINIIEFKLRILLLLCSLVFFCMYIIRIFLLHFCLVDLSKFLVWCFS